jgi:hypothetical protein
MSERTLGDHHLDHLVCTSCHQLRSVDTDPDRPDRDTCRCTRTDRDPAQRELQVSCRICAACGLAIAPGHTRWRQNFCADCRSTFVQLRALLGWSQIPLGIHSFVNQTGVLGTEELAAIEASPAGERLLDRRASQLATELTKMVGGIDRLYAHVDRLTGERLTALDATGEPMVPWDDYVHACRDAGITDDDGWAALLREFGLGDWVDDVRAFRRSRSTKRRR